MTLDPRRIGTLVRAAGAVAQAARRVMEEEDVTFRSIPGGTLGGRVFWTTLKERDGRRLQQNVFTRHARILDRDDRRTACGSRPGMERTWNR